MLENLCEVLSIVMIKISRLKVKLIGELFFGIGISGLY